MKNFSEKAKKKIITWRKRAGELFSCNKELSGITVIELVLILVIKVLMHIECIESEKNLKNKLYTRYTQ